VTCQCSKPIQSLNRVRHGDMCLRCGRQVTGDWVADDDTMGDFFDRLAEGMSLALDLDPGHPFEFFRRHCLARERAGRERFRLQYLARENAIDAMEEAADLANYCSFGQMVHRRSGSHDSVHLLMAAHFAAKAYECLLRERAECRGTPISTME
jgi:hypothetical protein